MSKIQIYIKSILIPLLSGLVIGLITSGAMNYINLIQPEFAPPAILFPIVWSILYTLMGISYGILESNSLINTKINIIYYLQLIVNLLWSIIFFTLELRLLAFLWIIVLIILVSIMIYQFYTKNKTAGLLQIPYLLWLIFAGILNFSIYQLNI